MVPPASELAFRNSPGPRGACTSCTTRSQPRHLRAPDQGRSPRRPLAAGRSTPRQPQTPRPARTSAAHRHGSHLRVAASVPGRGIRCGRSRGTTLTVLPASSSARRASCSNASAESAPTEPHRAASASAAAAHARAPPAIGAQCGRQVCGNCGFRLCPACAPSRHRLPWTLPRRRHHEEHCECSGLCRCRDWRGAG